MQKTLPNEAEKYLKRNHQQRIWRKIVCLMACAVVFGTTSILIFPASTMEKVRCGLAEHTHSESCYKKVTMESSALLSCTYASLGVHVHTADCYGGNGNLLCGRADYLVHEHNADCVDGNGAIVCQIPEVSAHEHTDSCYRVVETEPAETPTTATETVHSHGADCYASRRGELICRLPETEGHTHGQTCFAQGKLTCQLTEQGGHTHSTACYESLLVCGLSEKPAHRHTDDCYEMANVLICERKAGSTSVATTKTREAAELEQELLCTEPAAQVHIHSEDCFVESAAQEKLLTCVFPEDENHTHVNTCYGTWQLICGRETHTHDLRCMNDPEADVETEAEWIASFSAAELTGQWAKDVVAIARTQLGYTESTRNYTVMEDNETIKGYTRYGAWCGAPYGDWGAMFASFCLHYAGVEDMPLDSSCPEWIQTLMKAGLYHPSGEYMPTGGELIFFDLDGDAISDHAGIVEEVDAETEPAKIKTIEGSIGDRVAEQEYGLDDTVILGYASLPAKFDCGMEEHAHTADCMDETGALICTQSEHIHTEKCTDTAIPETELADEPNTLRYRGTDYEVSLRYDNPAGIPGGARLEVTELTGEAYQDHLKRACEAMGYGNNHVLVQFSDGEDGQAVPSEDVTVVSGSINFARFFDLSILVGDEEIEPLDTVEVTIRYDETVQIPAGEKTAVHFADSGEVEILNAEAAIPMMLMSGRSTHRAEKTENEANGSREFVFLQDSFSVTGTVTLAAGSGDVNIEYNKTTTVNWCCRESEIRTLTVMAEFDDTADGKSVIIKIPTGFQIRSYSATDATPAISGVTKVAIDGEFKDYVLSSTLKPASLQGDIAGVKAGDTWATQVIKGYTPWEGSIERDVQTFGGDIEYRLAPGTQHVKLVVTLHINSRLLSHTASTEQMEPIQIITTSATESHTTRIVAEATDVPVVGLYYSTAEGGAEEYKAAEKGDVPGRSAIIPIKANSTNYKIEHGSYFDSAAFTLTYPEGVFLEPDSLFCTQVDMDPGEITGLIKNGTKEVLKDHMSVAWIENENGGGTVTWLFTKTYYYHGGPTFGADFTANTDTSKTPYYRAGDIITGFSMSGEFERNGKKGTIPPLPYERTLVEADGGKDIRLIPRHFTRRDITEDFRTTEYDYVLGAFNVYSNLHYTDNTFWFENTDGLKITALSLMGRDIRNITVVTNKGNEYTLSDLSENGTNQGVVYAGTLLELSAIGGQEDEYITGCLFTADIDQGNYAYISDYVSGGFVYYGQFQDGDNDGSREGSVTLRQLEDNTTYQAVQTAIQNDSLDDMLVMRNAGSDPQYGGKPIAGTDHTEIGWYNTGVHSVSTGVVNTDTNNAEDVYYIGDALRFTSEIRSGNVTNTQNMLIDPVLVISLPEGITLNTASVTATSAAGICAGEQVRLVQDGEATEKVINGVTWTTYRFKSPQMLALVAEEQALDNVFRPRNCITASFDTVVDPGCDQYTLSMADLVMWDVRNTAYETDTLQFVIGSGINGDAVHSSPSGENYINGDRNNLLGYGEAYAIASDTGTVVVKPLINLYVDLGIKSISSRDIPITNSGFTAYNGLPGSVVPVIPSGYADVQLKYVSTSTTPYYEGTAIYVPVPKMGEDYAKYFENIELDDPMNVQKAETFDYTMDLTGPVKLESADGDEWITRYAVRTISSNPSDYSIEHQDWEPVVQNGGAVQWLTEEQVADWSKVAMIKFVSTADIESLETGSAVMRLYVHDVNDSYGPACAGGINYWRGYCKAVVDEIDHSGNWKYTSVVAATPAVETLIGQIFIDEDHNGIFGDGEPVYIPGEKPFAYTAELSKDDGTMAVQSLAVNSDGSFALLDSQGNPAYLPAGEYTVTIRKNADTNFLFANTGDAIGGESPETAWHNNVSSSNNTVATWKFTVNNNGRDGIVHRVGVGLKAGVSATVHGIKTFSNGTLQPGAYCFRMEPTTQGAPEPKSLAGNAADGSFSFEALWYEFPGTYVYRVTEDRTNPIPGVNYDGHVTIVTVTVTKNSSGVLTAEVTYDNSAATTAADRAVTNKAAFTNAYSYELPETGGAGTASYIAGGLLFTVAAVLGYIHNLRRKKEET